MAVSNERTKQNRAPIRLIEALERLEVIADGNASVQLVMPAVLSWRRAFQEQLMSRVNLAELDRQLAL